MKSVYDLPAFDSRKRAVTLADIGASAAKAYFVRIAVVGAQMLRCGCLAAKGVPRSPSKQNFVFH